MNIADSSDRINEVKLHRIIKIRISECGNNEVTVRQGSRTVVIL